MDCFPLLIFRRELEGCSGGSSPIASPRTSLHFDENSPGYEAGARLKAEDGKVENNHRHSEDKVTQTIFLARINFDLGLMPRCNFIKK